MEVQRNITNKNNKKGYVWSGHLRKIEEATKDTEFPSIKKREKHNKTWMYGVGY